MGKVKRSKLSGMVIKALGIFGSLEALKMLCSVVRTKLVALWIGAVGVGVISLYNSTLEMLKCLTLFNMRQSSVPSIAGAPDEVVQKQLCRSVDRLGVIIGLASTILVIILSPLLSVMTFGSYDYSWGYALLAPTMLATGVSDARQAIFQGLGQLRFLAKTSLFAVIASTLVAIPLFYFFRMAAIVPVLLIFPVFTALFLVFTPGARMAYPPTDATLFRSTVKSLLRLGSYLTVGMSLAFIADYALRVYLERKGGASAVGLFQSGYTIVKSYVGIFFTAIAMEFFPRLSSTITRRRYSSLIVSHEINISLRILLPVIIVFISVDDYIVRLLYSSSFLSVVPYITVAIIGTLFRAISWCLAYVIVAKGDGRIYLVTEAVSAVSLLLFSWIGWNTGGFEGLGWAYLGQFAVYMMATWSVVRFRYGMKLSASVWRLAAFSLIMAGAAYYLRLATEWWMPLLLLVPVAAISVKPLLGKTAR